RRVRLPLHDLLRISNVFDTLQVYLGSVYVNDFNRFGRTFQVRAQAEGAYRAEPEDVVRIKTRNNAQGMVPLGSVVNLRWRSGSEDRKSTRLNPSHQS